MAAPLALLLALLAACSPPEGTGGRSGRPAGSPAGPAAGGEAPSEVPADRGPSEAARRVAERLAARGGLRVATTKTETIYEPRDDGGFDGFQMRLAAAFADWLGVKLSIKVVGFDDFFSVGGVVPRDGARSLPAAGAVPDLFGVVDLYVHSIALLPWRRPLIRFVPVAPSRIMTVSRKGEELRSLRDLSGKRVVVMRTTSYEAVADELRGRFGLDYAIARMPYGADVYGELEAGRADVTLRDSLSLLKTIGGRPGLVAGPPASDLQQLGWATAPGDEELAAALEEFLAKARAGGGFERVWSAYYGVSLADYHGLIRYRPPSVLVLDREELDRVAGLRAAGGLTAAVDSDLTVYEPREGREPGGFHYALLVNLAEALDLPLRVVPVRFDEFWTRDGTLPPRAKSDPSYAYVPDLLREVDLYVAGLSPLPWRAKFLRFTGLFPNAMVWLAPAASPIHSPGDLEGKRVAILSDSSYEPFLAALAEREGLRLAVIPTTTEEEAVRLVAEGKADASISDASLAMARIREFPRLTLYPAGSTVETISWGSARTDEVLASILGKWIAAIQADGSFEAAWSDYFGSSFAEYLALVAMAGLAP